MNLSLQNIIKSLFTYSPESPILFTSPIFWVLLVLIIGFYSFFYRKNAIRNFYLLVVSLFLYYKTNGAFVFLLIFSTIFNYAAALAINKSARKKVWMIVSVAINLLVLVYFKYAYFFTESFNTLFKTNLEVVNWLVLWENHFFGTSFDATSILLPAGVSFFTFQAISYIVDVYRKKIEPVQSLSDFSFYLAFFPQLVAGPIVRASAFIPQLYQKYKLTREEFGHAVFMILKGLTKKLIFADFIAANFIDRILNAPGSYTGIENILAVYGYSLQIYADFSGYTDIAIGLALIFGFKLTINFNEPYKASTLTDFWRRWHISLSFWLRDYLYIPLGGNRKGKFRTYLNLLVTMILGGLWHGANLRFVVWGAIHGMGLVFDKILKGAKGILPGRKALFRIAGTIFTFNIVTFAWIFFRLENAEAIRQWFYQTRHNLNAGLLPQVLVSYPTPALLMIVGFILVFIPSALKEKARGWFIQSHVAVKIFISVVIILLIYQAVSSNLQPFIYFRF
jgi:D-alanyl-lipoteichoic acid acyltransferase DltB (MBOAT superfamily)